MNMYTTLTLVAVECRFHILLCFYQNQFVSVFVPIYEYQSFCHHLFLSAMVGKSYREKREGVIKFNV